MLDELVVRDLGVIEYGEVVFDAGMTALTGETGAGKTLVVEAISLLLGGRADAQLIRAGAEQARVDGRFHRHGDEVVLSRVIPRNGRSRAYIDGHPVPVAQLQALGVLLLDLHGQHGHQSLVATSAQRSALDAFGAIDVSTFQQCRAVLHALRAEQVRLGGDRRARQREMDMLRFQIDEIESASIVDAQEDDRLRAEEELLADAVAHQEAGDAGVEALHGEGGATELIATALRVLANRGPFLDATARIKSLAAELADATNDLRSVAERIEPNPERLDQIRHRRAKLKDLQRKYGDSLDAVLAFAAESSLRLRDLAALDSRGETIDAEIELARTREEKAFVDIVRQRRDAGVVLAKKIEQRLGDLAMKSARIVVEIEDQLPSNGDGAVTFLLAANPGSDPAPLAKVASGGELARIMLALRLALLEGRSIVTGDPPDTLLFDEVDAGIGGSAAVAVGQSLADMAEGRQVLVVTHLPQVAAFANNHVRISKTIEGGQTRTTVESLDDQERVTELARMLAGNDSRTARQHAAELLAERHSRKGSNSKPGPAAPRRTSRKK